MVARLTVVTHVPSTLAAVDTMFHHGTDDPDGHVIRTQNGVVGV